MSTNEPRSWMADDWWEACRQWESRPGAEGAAEVRPSEARVGLGGLWQVRFTAGRNGLATPAHLAVEIPLGWRPDHAPPPNCAAGQAVDELLPLRVQASVDEARLAWRVSRPIVGTDAFCVVDIVLVDGALPAGEALVVELGEPDGRRVQPPLWAQQSRFSVAVDPTGAGRYVRLTTQPTVTVFGGPPATLSVIASATATTGRPFRLSVQAQDAFGGNPASDYQATVELHTRAVDSWIPERVRLGNDGPATRMISQAMFENPGVHVIEALAPGRHLAGRSNPIGVDWMPDGWQVFFGDLHGHCQLDGGTGSLAEYYHWARDVSRLDFCAATIRAEGIGAAPMDEPTWRSVQEAAAECHREKHFVTFLAFQWGAGTPYGGKCVYYLGDEGPLYSAMDRVSDSVAKLLERLRDGPPVLVANSQWDPVGPAERAEHDEQIQTLYEIYSNRGYRESGGPTSAQAALAAGHRVGFIASSDTPYGRPGSGIWPGGRGGGLAAVLAHDLSREQLFGSLRRRRTYATTGARILVWFQVEDLMMGQSGRVGSSPQLHAKVHGTGPIACAEIVKNGEVLLSRKDPGTELDIRVMDRPETAETTYYYFRVVQEDGHMAWSSPIWVRPKATELPPATP